MLETAESPTTVLIRALVRSGGGLLLGSLGSLGGGWRRRRRVGCCDHVEWRRGRGGM